LKIQKFEISGLVLITPEIFRDERGYFLETFSSFRYREALGFDIQFVQDNMSWSRYGTIRGLHYQKEPYAQAKLVRCVVGRIIDVAVDIRPHSGTYGQYVSQELNEEEQRQLFIPRGFAHGFAVLSQQALVEYKCDAYYQAGADAGIRYDDPDLSIDWKLPGGAAVLSAKDLLYPYFKDISKGKE
jgi:dTDP-4-dehydrorhamnose 3,5-epimerase